MQKSHAKIFVGISVISLAGGIWYFTKGSKFGGQALSPSDSSQEGEKTLVFGQPSGTSEGDKSSESSISPSKAQVGASGATQGGVAAVGSEQQSAPSPTNENGCVQLTLKHKQLSGHSSLDSCGEHRNAFKVAVASLNKKSVCVRVDGTPVKFDLAQSKDKSFYTITLGNIAGPMSKITARYCLGDRTCPEDCTVPKDEFLDAIGGDEVAAAPKPAQKLAHGGKWEKKPGTKDGETDGEVSDELEAEIEHELHAGRDLKVFDGWIQEREESACVMVSKR